jgi:transcriptional regulator with XRE-family HTH domain
MTGQPGRPTTPPAEGSALGRLAVYRERREALHDDVREAAVAEGATQAEIARVSGVSRQWIARILADPDAR